MFVLFFLTQKIYSKNWFSYLFLFSIAFPVVLFLIMKSENEQQIVWGSFVILIYSFLLSLIKLCYKKINAFLVKKNFVDNKFQNKDFTYVEAGDYDDYWNEKLALEPSWLDKILSFLLLLLPLTFIGIIAFLFS
jgi:hypothetical protein